MHTLPIDEKSRTYTSEKRKLPRNVRFKNVKNHFIAFADLGGNRAQWLQSWIPLANRPGCKS